MSEESSSPAEPGEQWSRPWSTVWLVVWGTLTAVAMAVLTVLVVRENSALLSFDEVITDFTREWADTLVWPVTLSDIIGEATRPLFSALYIGVAFLVLVYKKMWRWAIFLVLSSGIGVIVTEVIKVNVGRQRPPAAVGYEDDLFKSFPSGHTSSGLYMYAMLGLLIILWALSRDKGRLLTLGNALFAFGVLLGITRLILGVHWPSDVIGGWLLGSAVLLLVAAVVRPDQQVPPWSRYARQLQPAEASGVADADDGLGHS